MEGTEGGEKSRRGDPPPKAHPEYHVDNLKLRKRKTTEALVLVRHLEYAPEGYLTFSCRLSSISPSSPVTVRNPGPIRTSSLRLAPMSPFPPPTSLSSCARPRWYHCWSSLLQGWGGAWLDHYVRRAGGMIEHLGDRKRKRDSLEKRSFHPFIVERCLAMILQIAIALLIITHGLYLRIVSAHTLIASVLGGPLYFWIAFAVSTSLECLPHTPTSIVRSTLWKKTIRYAFITGATFTGVPPYKCLPWSLMLAALHHVWEVIGCQVTQEPMSTEPLASLPPLFSALARVEPTSEGFLPMLKQFLRSKGEHKLLAQMEGPTAVYVADILDKVREHRAVASCEAWADFHVVFVRASVLPPSGILQAHPPPPALTLRVVGGIAYLLQV